MHLFIVNLPHKQMAIKGGGGGGGVHPDYFVKTLEIGRQFFLKDLNQKSASYNKFFFLF